ncbi:hypothetical protein BDB00DRAFT_869546 [Zychaea mexicana]|uniref:uncharacterized protein n=1 Tax=Zychaea mexicana TaxID=64656 RepID=UPI0022FDC641|nr:uncharacterized protein BDB00DRAFT_869546 [Zychaea mexicana]KAI9496246.1 hypothetical protein BDB00DRAFT_869546 [Zychaea mexicana]
MEVWGSSNSGSSSSRSANSNYSCASFAQRLRHRILVFDSFRKKKSSKKSSNPFTTSGLRKTKSTGNIADENQTCTRQTTSTTAPATDELQLPAAAAAAASSASSSSSSSSTPKAGAAAAAPSIKPDEEAATKVGGSTSSSSADEAVAYDDATSSSDDEDDASSVSSVSSSSSSSDEGDEEDDSTSASSDSDSVSSLPNDNTRRRPGHMTIPRAQVKANSSPSTPQESTDRGNYFSSGDLELLLSQETQARIDAQEKAAADAAAAAAPAPRKTALRFELPVTPSRSRSPNPAYSAYSRPRQRWSLPDEKMLDDGQKKKKKKKKSKKSSSKKSKRRSKWKNRIMGSDDEKNSDAEEQPRVLKVGDKVYLLHRPLPIFGHVRYMGTVNFDIGDDWVGVELESRVGKNDGSVNGHRYFQTDPHRGIFVRKAELGFT